MLGRTLLEVCGDSLEMVRKLRRALLLEALEGARELALEALEQRDGLALEPFETPSGEWFQLLPIVAGVGAEAGLHFFLGGLQVGDDLLGDGLDRVDGVVCVTAKHQGLILDALRELGGGRFQGLLDPRANQRDDRVREFIRVFSRQGLRRPRPRALRRSLRSGLETFGRWLHDSCCGAILSAECCRDAANSRVRTCECIAMDRRRRDVGNFRLERQIIRARTVTRTNVLQRLTGRGRGRPPSPVVGRGLYAPDRLGCGGLKQLNANFDGLAQGGPPPTPSQPS